jgi:holliday junction DNA helicase RuvA
MISYLEGTVLIRRDSFIILQVQGVGYKVFVSEKTFDSISKHESEVELFCHLHVRENALDLYGFTSVGELELFEILLDISGVGPKAALQISSIGSVEDFQKAITQRDERFFAGVHGIGKKKVQKIILELTGKIETLGSSNTKKTVSDEDQEVIDALLALGFPRTKVREVLAAIPSDLTTTEDRVRAALKSVRG